MVQIVDLAFPVCLHPDHKGEIHGGLSKRQWYAGLAMQAYMGDPGASWSFELLKGSADAAFQMADAMLEAGDE